MNTFLNKISYRYLFRKGSRKLSSLTILTTLGIGIGTAVLIVVLSVMNGFENELQAIKGALLDKNTPELIDRLERGKQFRDSL